MRVLLTDLLTVLFRAFVKSVVENVLRMLLRLLFYIGSPPARPSPSTTRCTWPCFGGTTARSTVWTTGTGRPCSGSRTTWPTTVWRPISGPKPELQQRKTTNISQNKALIYWYGFYISFIIRCFNDYRVSVARKYAFIKKKLCYSIIRIHLYATMLQFLLDNHIFLSARFIV